MQQFPARMQRTTQPTLHAHLTVGDTVSHGAGQKLRVEKNQPYIGDFKLVFNHARIRAAREAREALPTLDIIGALVERDNFVRFRPGQLAKFLDASIPTVERHLAKLKKLGLIEPDELEADKKFGIISWRICPYLSWKGKTDAMKAYLQALPEQHPWRIYNNPNS